MERWWSDDVDAAVGFGRRPDEFEIHRLGGISEALVPLRGELSDQQLHQLTLAIRSAIGIEALTWQTDVTHLTRDESVALMS